MRRIRYRALPGLVGCNSWQYALQIHRGTHTIAGAPMTQQFRLPGPLGPLPAGGGRTPGPLSFRPGIFLAPKQLAKATRKLVMPPPAGGAKTIVARDVPWSLYAKTTPALADVSQGALANCPLASLLAALAYTGSGQKRIESIVAEQAAVVETDLSSVADRLEEVPTGNRILSTRYFTVKLGGKSFEVSSVLYTDDANLNWTPAYMRSPTNILWPCVIEKAYAVKEGGYEALDSKGLTANAIWEVVVGAPPGGFQVTGKTEDSKIRAAADNAAKIPTMAASADEAQDVTAWHGFAVLGMKSGKIELYDPMMVRRQTVSLDVFRKNFVAILFGTP